MARAIRSVTSERGRDPRDYTIVAFGGAGPIHAAELAEDIGVGRVYVPLYPGLFSSLGLLFADLRYDAVKTILPVWTCSTVRCCADIVRNWSMTCARG